MELMICCNSSLEFAFGIGFGGCSTLIFGESNGFINSGDFKCLLCVAEKATETPAFILGCWLD